MAVGRGGIRIPIDGDVTGLNRALGQAEGALGAFGTKQAAIADKLNASGRTLTRNLTLPIVGAGVAVGKLAFDFQDSLTKVNALVGVSSKQTQAWGKQILDLAPKVGKSPKELADALYFITSSGISANKTMDALAVSAKLSASGLGETEAVADGLTSAMNAYAKEGLTASRAADIFTQTVKAGKAEASALAPVLGNVLPLAQSFGVTFDQVGAAIATMTLKGTDAETAVTNVSAVLSSFLNPGKQAKDTMHDFGLSSDDLRKSIRDRGLLPTLRDLNKTFDGNTEALGKILPNVRAVRGFLQLTGGDAKAVSAIFADVKNSTGAAGKSFEETAKGPAFRMRAALAEVQAEGVKIGDVLLPVAADAASAFGHLATAFDRLPDSAKKIVGVSALVAAALGPALRVAGGLTTAVGGIGRLAGIGSGTSAGTGAAGAISSAAGSRVFVTNWPPGMIAGGKGGLSVLPGGAGAAARGAAGAAIPGLGTIGAGGGLFAAAPIAAPLAIGAAAIGGGIALNKLDDKFGLLGPSKKEGEKAADVLRNSFIAAFRKGQPELQKVLQKGTLIDAGPLAAKITAEANGAMRDFSKAIKAGQPEAKRSTKQVIDAATKEIGQLSPQARRYAADSMVRMSAALESGGNAPKGTTKRLLSALEKELGRLPTATRKAAGEAMTAAQAFAASLQSVVGAAGSAASAVESFAARARAAAANPPDFSAFSGSWGGGGGGGGGGKKPGAKKSDEFGGYSEDALRTGQRGPGGLIVVMPRRGEARPISFADRTSAIIAARHRNDSLQDTQTRRAVLSDPAKVGGISNPDKLTAIGDKAVAEVRKKELDADAANIQNARNKVRTAIIGRRQTLRNKIAARRKIKAKIPGKSKGSMVNNPAYKKATDEIKRLRESLNDLWDQDRNYRQEYAEVQAEAEEWGDTIASLEATISGLPNEVPDDTGSAASDSATTADAAGAAATADAQARAAQAEAAALAARQESAAFGAFVDTLKQSPGIDPSGGVTVVQHIYGSVVQDAWAASWITSALQSQGAPNSGAYRSAA